MWFEISGFVPRRAPLPRFAMVVQVAKLASCIAYVRRSCYKADLSQIASKLTPVLVDLKTEMLRCPPAPTIGLEVGVQTDVVCRNADEMTSDVKDAMSPGRGSQWILASAKGEKRLAVRQR